MKYTKQLWPLLALGISINMHSSPILAAPYLGIQVGAANSSSTNEGLCNDKKSALTGRLSGGIDWRFSDNFKTGLELGLQDYQRSCGSHSRTGSNRNKLNMDALAVADFLLSEKYDVKALGGVAYVKSKYEVSTGLESHNDIKSKYYIVPKMGMGVGYNIFDHLNLNLTIFHEFEKHNTVGSATSILAGIQLH